VTVGKVASVKTDVSSEGSKGFTSEITVASPAFMANTSFSYHGDSGGPVFGIGIGGVGTEGMSEEYDGLFYLSYITPWKLLKSRIEKLSGKRLEIQTVNARLISSDGTRVEGDKCRNRPTDQLD